MRFVHVPNSNNNTYKNEFINDSMEKYNGKQVLNKYSFDINEVSIPNAKNEKLWKKYFTECNC